MVDSCCRRCTTIPADVVQHWHQIGLPWPFHLLPTCVVVVHASSCPIILMFALEMMRFWRPSVRVSRCEQATRQNGYQHGNPLGSYIFPAEQSRPQSARVVECLIRCLVIASRVTPIKSSAEDQYKEKHNHTDGIQIYQKASQTRVFLRRITLSALWSASRCSFAAWDLNWSLNSGHCG